MEWISIIQKLDPITGALSAVLFGLLVWERRDHSTTRDKLEASLRKNGEDAMKMTAVIEASKSAADARNDATKENTFAFQRLTQVVELLIFRVGPPA